VAATRRRWAGFFVLLGLLAGVAVAIPVWFNLRQQLRPEQLTAARERWRLHGPRDYDLEFTVRFDREPQPERYLVRVRAGRVTLAACDGQVVRLDPALGPAAGLAARAFSGGGVDYRVEGIFDRIEQALREESESARRNYTIATFDPEDGHPRRFVRRLRGTDRREEWQVLVRPPGEPIRGRRR
jgi:hypothetical protein